MPYDDAAAASPFCSGSLDNGFVLLEAPLAASREGCTSSMAEDASSASGAGWRTSREAAGVEFRVEEALLVDFEGATSDAAPGGGCRLFGASSSLRGDGALDRPPVVEDGASPPSVFASAMANLARGNRLDTNNGPKAGVEPSQNRRGLSPGLLVRKSPSSRDINAA